MCQAVAGGERHGPEAHDRVDDVEHSYSTFERSLQLHTLLQKFCDIS